jgi:hypothetical protein
MIDNTNTQYDKYLPIWQKCYDAVEGQEAVHSAGAKYLPELSGQEPTEYKKYLLRATFYNATGRTLDAMTGLIFRKPPVVEYPASLESVIKDVDMAGTPMMTFCELVVDELCKVSRVGVLVDYPSNPTTGLSAGQVQALGLRPYATIYKAKSILDWRYTRINNMQMLAMVKLQEEYEVQTDEYNWECKTQIRILELVEGVYRVRIYRQGDKNYELYSETFPLMNGAPIREIPFVFFSACGTDSDVSKPILIDLVNVNLSHYRSMADYEHGLHFTGLPTAMIWGAMSEEGAQLKIGSSTAMVMSDPAGHAEYLEFTGTGLGALRTALQDKQEMMAALGMNVLRADTKGVEAAETAAIHRASENSVLASLANAGSAGLTKVIQWLTVWAGVSPEQVFVRLNTDFNPVGMSPQMFAELTKAYLSNSISYQTYFDALQQGEVIKADVVMEDEKEQLESNTVDLVE